MRAHTQSPELADIIGLLNPENTGNFNRLLAHAIGLNEAIVFASLIAKYQFYKEKGVLDAAGCFYSTADDLQESTCLTRRQQEQIIANLIKLELIKTSLKGMPAKRHFKITCNFERLKEIINSGYQKIKDIRNNRAAPVSTKCRNKIQQNVETSFNKMSKQDSTKCENKIRQNVETSFNKMSKQDSTKCENMFQQNVEQNISNKQKIKNKRDKQKKETKETNETQLQPQQENAEPTAKDPKSLVSFEKDEKQTPPQGSELKYWGELEQKIYQTLISAGINTYPADPWLTTLVTDGTSISLLQAACSEAKRQLPGERIGIRYIAGILKNWKTKAENHLPSLPTQPTQSSASIVAPIVIPKKQEPEPIKLYQLSAEEKKSAEEREKARMKELQELLTGNYPAGYQWAVNHCRRILNGKAVPYAVMSTATQALRNYARQ